MPAKEIRYLIFLDIWFKTNFTVTSILRLMEDVGMKFLWNYRSSPSEVNGGNDRKSIALSETW
jgi:hypothetical protein